MTKLRIRFCLLAPVIVGLASPTFSSPQQPQIILPDQAAALVKPLLDLREQSFRECGESGLFTSPSPCITGEAYNHEMARSRRLNDLLQRLINQHQPGSEEALVTLMCFNIGESEEELDAVMNQGKRMLPLLEKYKANRPVFHDRKYSDSVYRSTGSKMNYFSSAIQAIKAGRRSSSD
jgi:hypothetical protein